MADCQYCGMREEFLPEGGCNCTGAADAKSKEATKMTETKRERALRLALNCGVIHEKAVDDWYEFKEADLIRLISLARAEAFKEAALIAIEAQKIGDGTVIYALERAYEEERDAD